MTGSPTLAPLKGGPIRALVTVVGLDQHEAGSLAVARLLRDAGAEVIYAGRFQLPESIAAIAIEEDVDVVGVSAHSWEFLAYAPELVERLGAARPPIPIAVGGSVITSGDREQLRRQGIDAAVPPTATGAEIIETFRRLASVHRGL
jgi:methylmalonyl-CoA mutase C-terminal domain/subunit